MINKATFSCKFGNKELFKNRTMKFSSTINVIFGQNGSGKTTLLKMLGAYTGCKENGWTFPPHSYGNDKINYPDVFKDELKKGKHKMKLDWDGCSSFMHISGDSDKSCMGGFGTQDQSLVDWQQSLYEIMNHPSTGEIRLNRLTKIYDILHKEEPPNWRELPKQVYGGTGDERRYYDYTSEPGDYVHQFVDYINTLPKPEIDVPTLIIDEPEHGLSIPLQSRFWRGMIYKLAAKAQLIITTHSPFALNFYGRDGFFEIEEGYAQQCLEESTCIIDILAEHLVKKDPEINNKKSV